MEGRREGGVEGEGRRGGGEEGRRGVEGRRAHSLLISLVWEMRLRFLRSGLYEDLATICDGIERES